MTRYIIRNHDAVTDRIINRTPFANSTRSLHGDWYDSKMRPALGVATPEIRQALSALIEAGKRVYVVYSYSTPIGWAVEGDELLTVPDMRYSNTTSQHQSKILGGRHVKDGEPYDWTLPYTVTGERVKFEDPGTFREGKGHQPFTPQGFGDGTYLYN